MSHGLHKPPPGSHAHEILGDAETPQAGQIHTLPEGSVLAKDGSTISWSRAPDGSLTALGSDNRQLVVSRFRPSKTAGADVLHGGDMTTGAVDSVGVLPVAGDHPVAGDVPAAGDQIMAGVAGNFDPGQPAPSEDPIKGLQFAYSTLGEFGGTYLTVRYLGDETRDSAFVEIIGFISSAKFEMQGHGDITKVPSKVSAKFLPHHTDINWEGDLDLTESPVKALARIKDWRFDAFANEFSGAAYFDPLSQVLTDAFGQDATSDLPPGVIAKSAAGVAGRAAIWGICGAAAVAGAMIGGAALGLTLPVSAPLVVVAASASFVASAAASVGSDLWSSVTDDIQDVLPEPPPNPDIPVDEQPDDGCFAAGTAVALPDNRSLPIERVAVGDLIASREASAGQDGARRVTRTFKHLGKRTVDLSLDTGEQVRTTSVHRFFTLGRGIVSAGELEIGDRLRTLTGPPCSIVGISPGPAGATVYNLTVEGLHTYFVADAGVWVHNDKHTEHDDPPPPDPDGSGGGSDDPSGPDDDGGTTPGGDSGSGGGSGPTPA
jgi:anti-sigma factor RsiW